MKRFCTQPFRIKIPGRKKGNICGTAVLFFLIAFFNIVPAVKINAQELLKYQDAVGILLNNNYDIRISSNLKEQAVNNNTAGNAGMLPMLDAEGAYSRSSNSLKQKYNTGNEVNRDASAATNTSADLGASWTIFDGLKMFYLKEKLSQLSEQSMNQLLIQMENSMVEVTKAYFSIVRQQQLLRSMQEEIKFAEERKKIAERKLNNGSGSKLELLQAKTELNRQRAAEIKLQSDEFSARINLNRLLGKPVETTFEVEDSVIVSYQPRLEDLKKTVIERNALLNYYKKSKRIAELGLKEAKSLRMPVVGLNAHYIYSKNTSEAGFLLLNQSNGFNYGVTASLPLFRGLTINRQIKNSRLNMLNAEIAYESAETEINGELLNSWRALEDAMSLLRIEEENILYAKEVLTVSQERYRIGLSNNVEMLDAQRTYEEAMTRLADARYNAKISEIFLKKVNGELVVLGDAVK